MAAYWIGWTVFFSQPRVSIGSSTHEKLAVVGSTGSIGQNTLRVVEHLSDRFKIFALAANSAVDRLAEQTAAFHPAVVAISDDRRVDEFRKRCRELECSASGIGHRAKRVFVKLLRLTEVDIVVSAAVGAAGLHPTYSAVAAGKTVALANKEAMVLAGELLRQNGAAERREDRSRSTANTAPSTNACVRDSAAKSDGLILTASGGPFRDTPVEEFDRHHSGTGAESSDMADGQTNYVDSATLMNKGLEVIEARWLFDIRPEKIDIMVHPQSIMHSMVEFVDGSIVAQLGTADMRQPIQYALTYPERLPIARCAARLGGRVAIRFLPPGSAKVSMHRSGLRRHPNGRHCSGGAECRR